MKRIFELNCETTYKQVATKKVRGYFWYLFESQSDENKATIWFPEWFIEGNPTWFTEVLNQPTMIRLILFLAAIFYLLSACGTVTNLQQYGNGVNMRPCKKGNYIYNRQHTLRKGYEAH